jgi:hypothetical protein
MGTLTPPNDSASAARFLPSAECSLLGFVGQTSFFQIPEIRSNQTEKQISSALSSPRRACRTPLGAACSSAGPPTPAQVTPRCPRSRWTNRPKRPSDCFRLVKPIRREFPELPILVGLWNAADEGKMDSGDLQTTGANQVVTTLQETALSDSTAVALISTFSAFSFRKHLSGAVVKPRTSSFASSVPRRAGHRSWT